MQGRAGMQGSMHLIFISLPQGLYFIRPTSRSHNFGYQLASGKEQMIKALHTQNPRPNWGFGFDYRLISSPGFYVTQNSNHKSYRLFSNYQGKRKRYAAFLILVGNTIKKIGEWRWIETDSLLQNPNFKKRFSIPVNLGNASLYQPNPFSVVCKYGKYL